MVAAREDPLPAAVAPFAVVVALAVWSAFAVIPALVDSAGPVRMEATVRTFEIAMLATPVRDADDPPPAPPSVSVVVSSVLVASMFSALMPVMADAAARPACTATLIRLMATEAPTPTEPPSCFAVALAWLLWPAVAFSATSALPAELPAPRTSAAVVAVTEFTATEPAIDTEPELFLPEIDVAVKFDSPVAGPWASTMTLVAPRVEPFPMKASVRTSMMFTATPMASPNPDPPPLPSVVPPSAVVVTVFLAFAVMVCAPVVVTFAPVTCAFVFVPSTDTDSAPATSMVPSEVDDWPFARSAEFALSLFWVAPPLPALDEAVIVASCSASSASVAAVLGVALVESMAASVVWLRWAIATPAPAVASFASAMPLRVAWLTAVTSRSPVTVMRAVLVTLLIARAVTVRMATAASKLAVPSAPAVPSSLAASDPGLAPASTVEVDERITLPLAVTTAEPPTVTEASENTIAASPYFLFNSTGPIVEDAVSTASPAVAVSDDAPVTVTLAFESTITA
ncbi:hypothetical protein GCM10027052_26750 [Parafrigoribacterium mesophilum]